MKNLSIMFGGLCAVDDFNLEVEQGELIAIIGPNGAGKSTILRTISGLEHAKSGSIQFRGTELTKMKAHKIVELGIAHVRR